MNWIKRGRTPLIVTLTLALFAGMGALFASATPVERVRAVSAMGTGPVLVNVAQTATTDDEPTLKGIRTDHTSVGTCPALNEIYIEGWVNSGDSGGGVLEMSGCYALRAEDGAVRIGKYYYLLETSRFIAAGYMAGWTETFHNEALVQDQCLNGTHVDTYTSEVVNLAGCYALNHNGGINLGDRYVYADGVSKWYAAANSIGFYAGQKATHNRNAFPVCYGYQATQIKVTPKTFGPQAEITFETGPRSGHYQCRAAVQNAVIGFVPVDGDSRGEFPICDCKPQVIKGAIPNSVPWFLDYEAMGPAMSLFPHDAQYYPFSAGIVLGYEDELGPFVEIDNGQDVWEHFHNEDIQGGRTLALVG